MIHSTPLLKQHTFFLFFALAKRSLGCLLWFALTKVAALYISQCLLANSAIGYLGRLLTVELLGLRILNLLIINYSLLNEEASRCIPVVDGNSWRILKQGTSMIKLCLRNLWQHLKTNLELGEIICEDLNQAGLKGNGKVRRENCQAWEPQRWWIWPKCSWDSFLPPSLSLSRTYISWLLFFSFFTY